MSLATPLSYGVWEVKNVLYETKRTSLATLTNLEIAKAGLLMALINNFEHFSISNALILTKGEIYKNNLS